MPKTRRPLSPRQRLALDRRQTARETADRLATLTERLNDPSFVPENQRAKVANALNVILGHGWLFTVACAKAGVARSWPLNNAAPVWTFIDEQNALFARTADPDTVARWNEPDYDATKGGRS